MSDGRGETADDLLALAEHAGHPINRAQLKRWHSAGLIPRPRRRSLGKGHGTVSLYPPGTQERLRRVLELRGAPERFLWQHVFWRLWWEGWTVEQAQLRTRLEVACGEWEKLQPWLADADAAATLITRLEWIPSQELPQSLLELRRDPHAVQAVSELFRIFSGRFEQWEDPEARRALLRISGLDRAQQDRIGSNSPWLRGSLPPQLVELSHLITGVSLRAALDRATDDQVALARDEVQQEIGIFYSLALTLEQMGSAGKFGLGSIPDPRDLGPWVEQWLVLTWLVIREQQDLYTGFRAIATAAEVFASREVFIDIGRGTAKGMPPRR
jgi:hypothetical protein